MTQNTDTSENGDFTYYGDKMIFVGLSEAGKTAIRDFLFGGKAVEEVEGLSATINYVRQIITTDTGKIFTLLDLGGQRIFLERYLNQFSPFIFHRVKALCYIVDVGARDRFDSAKAYFDHALERLRDRSPTAKLFVLLHKFDLLDTVTARKKTIQQLKARFQKNVDHPIVFFVTSIYDNSLRDAFKEITRQAFPELTDSLSLVMDENLAFLETEHQREVEDPSKSPKDQTHASTISSEEVQPRPTQAEPADELDLPELAKVMDHIEKHAEPVSEVESFSEEVRPISISEFNDLPDDDLDSFTAAERLVETLESLIFSIDLAYIALYGKEEAPLVEIGDRDQYLEISCELSEVFNPKDHIREEATKLQIVETEKFFLVAQPIGASHVLLLAGELSGKTQLLERLPEFQVTLSTIVQKAFEDSNLNI